MSATYRQDPVYTSSLSLWASPADEVDRIVAEVEETKFLVLDRSVGVLDDESDVDLAVSQRLQRFDRVTVDQAYLEPRVCPGQGGGRRGIGIGRHVRPVPGWCVPATFELSEDGPVVRVRLEQPGSRPVTVRRYSN